MKRSILIGALVAGVIASAAGQQTSTFFRIVSPTTTVITSFSPDGTIVWSNAATIGATGRIQRAATLTGPSNWMDFAGHIVTGAVMTLRLFDPNAPTGMVLIPAGVNRGTDPDFGAYSLTNDASFFIDRYAVTKALWDEVKDWNGGNGYNYTNAGSGKAANHPVQTLNWCDSVKWCNARSEKDGRTPVYYTDVTFTQIYKTGRSLSPYAKTAANGYRLPTDVQWEYAARGGLSSGRFPWEGDTIDHDKANYCGDSAWYGYDKGYDGFDIRYSANGTPCTSPVGSFAPNGFGLYDMAGNVYAWCWDWLPGAAGSRRVTRGGAWKNYPHCCRVGERQSAPPDYADDLMGVRAVLPASQ